MNRKNNNTTNCVEVFTKKEEQILFDIVFGCILLSAALYSPFWVGVLLWPTYIWLLIRGPVTHIIFALVFGSLVSPFFFFMIAVYIPALIRNLSNKLKSFRKSYKQRRRLNGR